MESVVLRLLGGLVTEDNLLGQFGAFASSDGTESGLFLLQTLEESKML